MVMSRSSADELGSQVLQSHNCRRVGRHQGGLGPVSDGKAIQNHAAFIWSVAGLFRTHYRQTRARQECGLGRRAGARPVLS